MTPDEIVRGLSEAMRRKLGRHGHLLIPKQISWRRAAQLERMGAGTIYPFHQRWLGRFDPSPAVRALLQQEKGRA